MMGWLRNLFGGQRRAGRALRLRRSLKGSYDAAQTTADNRRHWANADMLSAADANTCAVRATLRKRARYEWQNNSYCKGIISTIANDIIGTGPRLQVMLESNEANSEIERFFGEWARESGLAEKLRTARQEYEVAGETFVQLVSNPALRTETKLSLALIDASRIESTQFSIDDRTVDGISYDSAGNPTAYWVQDEDRAFGKSVRVPAAQMLHWFRHDRAGQIRGVPTITSALPLFAQLRRFTLAVLTAAETAADHAGVLYTDSPADGSAVAGDDALSEIEIERGLFVTLPDGWDIRQLDAKQPATTYPQFKSEILLEICRCLDMPGAIAIGSSAGYNYASGRLDFQRYHRSIDVARHDCEIVMLRPILSAWLAEAELAGILPAAAGDILASAKWIWPGWEHVDPAKEANAQAMRLENNTTTLADECARQGLDWEEVLRQRAREKSLAEELGLSQPPSVRISRDFDEVRNDEEEDEAAA
jgi:lambda family phage portal protein